MVPRSIVGGAVPAASAAPSLGTARQFSWPSAGSASAPGAQELSGPLIRCTSVGAALALPLVCRMCRSRRCGSSRCRASRMCRRAYGSAGKHRSPAHGAATRISPQQARAAAAVAEAPPAPPAPSTQPHQPATAPAEAETAEAAAATARAPISQGCAAGGLPSPPGFDRPSNAWGLGSRVFEQELDQLIGALQASPISAVADFGCWLQRSLGREAPRQPLASPAFVSRLTLDVDGVLQKEEARGVPESTPLVQVPFFVLCWAMDRLYEGRPIAKFWTLETVARIPYFSYISVLHLYESLGWWRTPQLRDIHHAEENNELHHLLIMEALGGNAEWVDRFLAQHAALLYYWIVTGLFVIRPEMAYNFSLLVEEHAYVTYAQFVEENRELLRKVPPPPVAVAYYSTGDLYLFDKFHTGGGSAKRLRRPPCNSLLHVFENIRDDELEHVQTMRACQDWWAGTGLSPLPEVQTQALGEREAWHQWAAEVASLELHPMSSQGPGQHSAADGCHDLSHVTTAAAAASVGHARAGHENSECA